jgi:predicted phosphoribosyltransferase
MRRFVDRADAGRFLAAQLDQYAGRPDVIVLALPRGGVPVAFEVAQALQVPLDIFLVRKIGFPGHEEFALGAIASGGVRVLNPSASRIARFSQAEMDQLASREQVELERREHAYRGDRPGPDVAGRTAILVDDGLATGTTMRAAIAALKQLGPARIVVAVPVASEEACDLIRQDADDVVCGLVPEQFFAVGQWYERFGQTSDEEVQELLFRAQSTPLPAAR